MTSAARKKGDPRLRGFTLLELVVVLALAMMIIGGAAGMMYFNRDEARLNNAMGEVEILAKRARSLATLQQRPYALEFTAERITMLPYAEALMTPSDREYLEPGSGGQQSINANFEVEADLRLLVRRWATGDWDVIERQDRQVWRFDPEGICEPLGVRFEMENGNWIAVLFHPLTAAVTETESEIK